MITRRNLLCGLLPTILGCTTATREFVVKPRIKRIRCHRSIWTWDKDDPQKTKSLLVAARWVDIWDIPKHIRETSVELIVSNGGLDVTHDDYGAEGTCVMERYVFLVE